MTTSKLFSFQTADYIDVATKGVASQSSLSKWSRPNDPQRAVQAVSTDFAFHTDSEKHPWWQLDLKHLYFPEFIVISNRRREQFQSVSRALAVEVSVDGSRWKTLHSGEVDFGTVETGDPLALPLQAKTGFRYLRLTNRHEGYLHLSEVNIFLRDVPEFSESNLTFFSNRTDGLGERLKAIVNTIALSKKFGGDFCFTWEPIAESVAANHSIGQVDEIFSSDFIEKHVKKETPSASLSDFFAGFIKEDSAASTVVLTPQTNIFDISPNVLNFMSEKDMSEAFWEIEFSEKVNSVIEKAKSVPLNEGSVGLHMRAGDIIFGRYRFNSRYVNKVVPYPLAVELIERETEKGNEVVLFGQDRQLSESLSHTYDVEFSGHYHDEYSLDVVESAVFDIVLMSRCQRVIAGKSGFFQLAKTIGGFEGVDPQTIFPQSESADIVRKFLINGKVSKIDFSDLQKSFSCMYAVTSLGDCVSRDEKILLLKKALSFDPENTFYSVLLSVNLFLEGEVQKSSEILQRATLTSTSNNPYGALLAVVSEKHPDGSIALGRFLADLQKMADAGINAAVGVVSVCKHILGDDNAAREYRKKYDFPSDAASYSPLDNAVKKI